MEYDQFGKPMLEEGDQPYVGEQLTRRRQLNSEDPRFGTSATLSPTQNEAKLLNKSAYTAFSDEASGIASVHVQCDRVGPPDSRLDGVVLYRIVGKVSWDTSMASGHCYIDLTEGATFSIPGARGLSIDVYLWALDQNGTMPEDDNREQPDVHFDLKATLHWGTSISPKPVRYADARRVIPAASYGDFMAMPERADSMSLLATDSSLLANVSVEFCGNVATDAFSGAPLSMVYQANIPVNPTPVVAGANYYRIKNDNPEDDLTVLALFLLKL